MKTLTGIVRGRTIELTEESGLAEGAEVELLVTRSSDEQPSGDGFAAAEGALADDPEWDEIMAEIQQSRRWERPKGNGAT